MKKQIYYYHIAILLLLAGQIFYAAPPEKVEKKEKENVTEKMIAFRYENEDLVNVINFIAAQKEVNVVLPQGADAIKAKLTFKLDKRVTIDEAWRLLKTILDVAGLSIIPKDNLYVITKTTPEISRTPMPVFIGTNPKELPDSDQRIRYVYYLSNIKVPAPEEEAASELTVLFKGLMEPGYVFKVDTVTNAIIVAGKARQIKAAIEIVQELDKAGFQEKMEILHLRHTQANIVANLFMQQILQPENVNRYRLDTRQQTETYFSKNTKIIPEPRTNSLIILGRAQTVDRIKDFINEYIDKDIESGKSILHVKKLQYLDASQVAKVLKRVLESGRSAVAEQARTEGGPATGPERFFDEVKVFADVPEEEAEKELKLRAEGEGEAEVYKYKGGNNIIVAARNDDWKRIKKLIEELDDPQPQVLIEVLIADLTVNNAKQLGSQSRDPKKIPLPGQIEPQFAHLQQSMANDNDNPTTIQADLLRKAYNENGSYASSNATAVATIAGLAPNTTNNGSTLISFNDNDGQTWSLLQVLNRLGYSKILSHPHIIATNNKTALIQIGQTRLVQGGTQQADATATVKKEEISANLAVKITPLVSEGKIVNLTVEIDISEFTDPDANATNNTRATRKIITNANVKDGDILALGGLIRSSDQHGLNETPILSKIPILGWFFKRRTSQMDSTNLTVFISPMIIQPRLRGGISEFTSDYIGVARHYSKEGALFDTLKQPITRWFFKTGINADTEIDKFIAKDEIQSNDKVKQYTKLKNKKEKNTAMLARHNILRDEQKTIENKTEDTQESTQHDEKQLLASVVTNQPTPPQSQEILSIVKTANNDPYRQAEITQPDQDTNSIAQQKKEIILTDNKKSVVPVNTQRHENVTLKPQGIIKPQKQNDIMLLTHDKQKRSQALQNLINQKDENPLLKTAQTSPIRYLQS